MTKISDEQLKQMATKHGPTVVVAVAAVAAVRLMMPTPAQPIVSTAKMTTPRTMAKRPAHQQIRDVARLVSCGDMVGSNGAHVDGDDSAGTIVLGPGASGGCTLLFGDSTRARSCSVVGGVVKKLTNSDLVIGDASPTVTYDCKIAK